MHGLDRTASPHAIDYQRQAQHSGSVDAPAFGAG